MKSAPIPPQGAARVRFPLYLKILLWFFLNVLSLFILFYLVLGARVGPGLEGLLQGFVGERIHSVSNVIGRDLRAFPPEDWNAILQKFSESYNVSFALFSREDRQIAGESMELPKDVSRQFVRPWKRERMNRVEDPPPPQGPLLLRRAGDPPAYWVALPIRIRPPGPPQDRSRAGSAMAILVVRSETLSGNGLLVDVRPWLWTGAGALVFSGLFWLPLVRGITRSISQMTEATGRIASGEFDISVDQHRNDELGRLGCSINRMAERLQGFVSNQRRFMGDIAHELCTPIARTQMALGALEVRTPEEHREYLRDADEEMEHMSAMVNELLSFSKASLTREEAELHSVALLPLIEAVAAREAPEAEVEIRVPERTSVLAEPGLLGRAVANVLRNAARYAASDGPIRIESRQKGREVTVTVTDSGPGVPAETLPKIFDPFFRPEEARTRESGGTGLGLAIVKTCVEACRGRVAARNLSPKGFEVVITLGTGE